MGQQECICCQMTLNTAVYQYIQLLPSSSAQLSIDPTKKDSGASAVFT